MIKEAGGICSIYAKVNSTILSVTSKGSLQVNRGPVEPTMPFKVGRTSSSDGAPSRCERKCTDSATEMYLLGQIQSIHQPQGNEQKEVKQTTSAKLYLL